MAKFAVGDTVAKDKERCGKVAGVFTTFDGKPRYAVENEGVLWFILEDELAPNQDRTK
jgi:hypothetical protein